MTKILKNKSKHIIEIEELSFKGSFTIQDFLNLIGNPPHPSAVLFLRSSSPFKNDYDLIWQWKEEESDEEYKKRLELEKE